MAKRRIKFVTWCKEDLYDTKKINYTIRTYQNEIVNFTSDDDVSYSWLLRLRESWVEKIELINNEWYAFLYEDYNPLREVRKNVL